MAAQKVQLHVMTNNSTMCEPYMNTFCHTVSEESQLQHATEGWTETMSLHHRAARDINIYQNWQKCSIYNNSTYVG